jgi:hypothetical protein
MSYLIDASNLGGHLGGKRGSQDAEEVLRFLLPWSRSRGKVVVVFDGVEKTRVGKHYGALEVRWSGSVTADEVIRKEVERSPKTWTVVTNDQALARECRDLGAKVLSATTLAAKAQGAPARPGTQPLSPHPASFSSSTPEKPQPTAADRAYWQDIFGDDDST